MSRLQKIFFVSKYREVKVGSLKVSWGNKVLWHIRAKYNMVPAMLSKWTDRKPDTLTCLLPANLGPFRDTHYMNPLVMTLSWVLSYTRVREVVLHDRTEVTVLPPTNELKCSLIKPTKRVLTLVRASRFLSYSTS